MEDEIPTVVKEFYRVNCGTKFCEIFCLENKSKENTTFLVVPREHQKYNTGLERLVIHPERVEVPPRKSVRFKLTYLSYLENVTDNVEFDILKSDKLISRLQVHAQSIGPLLSCKSNTIKFLLFDNVAETMKRIEFANKENYDLKFCFDTGGNGQTFDLSPICGIIPKKTKVNINLTFQPKESGVYFKRIFCLVQFQEPLILNVIGIYSPRQKFQTANFSLGKEFSSRFSNSYETYMKKLHYTTWQKTKKISYSQKCTEEYEKYLKELMASQSQSTSENRYQFGDQDSEDNEKNSNLSTTSKEEKQDVKCDEEQIFLTNNYIDMKNIREIAKATTLVNLSASKSYTYHWELDCSNHFRVKPENGVIYPSEKIIFSLSFCPSVSDRLYYKEMDLRIYPRSDDAKENLSQYLSPVTLPLTLNLIIISHTFPSDCCGWIPQCKVIPSCLQLRSCVPGEVVYGTFMIERTGHLPSTFTISLPKDSNYTVQPPLGCIRSDFQLLVIQFNGKFKEGLYVEDLKIIYNNSTEYFDFITLKTSVEIPQLIFGEENFFTFDGTFPLFKTEATIPVRNCTNLHLSFELVIPEDITWLEIPNPSGTLEPMSSSFIKAFFKPEEPCEYEGQIICKVNSTSRVDYIETISFQLTGSCQYGYLVATPNNHDFGRVYYGEEKEITVRLYNISSIVLHYNLIVKLDDRSDVAVAGSERNVKVKPEKGFICEKDSAEMTVTVKPHEKGTVQYYILCQIMQGDSEDIISCDNTTTIFTLKYNGAIRTFNVIDVSVEGGGPLFGPNWIWKMLSIDQLNRRLDSVESEEPLEIYFPEAELNSPNLCITLLLQTNYWEEVSWRIKKTSICSCLSTKESKDSREECPHQRVMSISPMEGKFCCELEMHIVVSYDRPEDCRLQWTIYMPHNRKIYLNCTIVTLSVDRILPASILMPPPTAKDPFSIRYKVHPIRLIWLYNNTSRVSFYKIESMTLVGDNKLNQKIFYCINPKGVIPPYSCLPLKIVFSPTEAKCYTVEIKLNNHKDNGSHITITSRGVNSDFPILPAFDNTLPPIRILKNDNICLECSDHSFYEKTMKGFSQVKIPFTVRNTSEKDTWAFHWHLFHVQDLITAHVEPCEGEIPPGVKASMTLMLNSFGYSSFIDFSLPCDVINYSLLEAYQSYDHTFKAKDENFKDYFTITENGITFDMPDIPEPEKPVPHHIYLTVNVQILGFDIVETLSAKDEAVLNSSKELDVYHKGPDIKPTSEDLELYKCEVEKLIWKVLNCQLFKEKSIALSNMVEYNYLEILCEHFKRDVQRENPALLTKSDIQSYFEDILRKLLGLLSLPNVRSSSLETRVPNTINKFIKITLLK